MNTKVGIGLPVFNGAESVGASLESLLAQSFGDFEIVISDNASVDGTQDICENFTKLDRRVRYIRQSENIGASANFEYVFDRSEHPLFMWAAHDDTRHPSYLEKAVEKLDACPDCVLAASDIELVHNEGGHRAHHRLTAEIENPRVAARYRSIVRDGGWSAIYGLIRREAVAKTRRFASLQNLAARGIAADYRLVELCLQGPFAYMPEFLLTCEAREERPQQALASYLDPKATPLQGTAFPWLFLDIWRLGKRYGLSLLDRLDLQREFLASARSPGTLHGFVSTRNLEAKFNAIAAGNKFKAFLIDVERSAFIGPDRWSLLFDNRGLRGELQAARSLLFERTRRLEEATRDLVDRTFRLEAALAELERLGAMAEQDSSSAMPRPSVDENELPRSR